MPQNQLVECLKKLAYDTSYMLDNMLADTANKKLLKKPIFENRQLTGTEESFVVDYVRINRLIRHEKNILNLSSFQTAVNVLSNTLKIMVENNKLVEGSEIFQTAKYEVCNFITQYSSERNKDKSGAFARSVRRFQGRLDSELSYFLYITPLYNVGGDFSEIVLSDATRIRVITDKEYMCVIDTSKSLEDIECYQKRLRFVIEHRASINAALPLDEAKDEYALVTNLIRLSRKCAPEFGQIYSSNSTHLDVLDVENAESYESTPQRRGFVKLGENDIRLLVTRYCEMSTKFSSGKKFRFLANSIARFGMACRHRRHSNKVVDYVIALEALLTEGPGESTLKLAHRAAALCGDDDMSRLYIWEFVREVYKFRSGVVHKSTENSIVINSKIISIDDVSYTLDKIVKTAILRMGSIFDNNKSKIDIHRQLDRSIYDKNLMHELEKHWK